jgi:hypothetical protein
MTRKIPRIKNMKEYRVQLYYTTSWTGVVEAENEDGAYKAALNQVDDIELMGGLQKDGYDIEETEDNE